MEKHHDRLADVKCRRKACISTTAMSGSISPAEAVADHRRDRSRRWRRKAARSTGSRPRSLWRAFRDGIPAAAEPAHRQGADPRNAPILASALHVIVIGGGDTGSDCIGTVIRQGALSVTQFEIMPRPPDKENKLLTWPDWPLKMRTSSSHEEGAESDFSVGTRNFSGDDGAVKTLVCARLDANFKEIPDSAFEVRADLVLLAMGFVHRCMRAFRSARLDVRSARQCRGRSDELQDLHPEGFCLRRHAARPIPHRLGDPRGPPSRARRRQVPDGNVVAAALTAV